MNGLLLHFFACVLQPGSQTLVPFGGPKDSSAHYIIQLYALGYLLPSERELYPTEYRGQSTKQLYRTRGIHQKLTLPSYYTKMTK